MNNSGKYLPIVVLALLLTLTNCSQYNPTNISSQYSANDVYETKLENAMTVLVKETHRLPLVTLNLLVKTGSATEGEFSGSGISHFAEHMLFKGTTNRLTGEIEKEIANLGGYINAYTTFDYTAYSIIVPADNFDIALNILADVITNSTFDEKEFEKEKDVVLKEIKLGQDFVDTRFSRLIFSSVYQEHPYRFPVIGQEDLFKQLTRDDILKYYRSNYIPNNMILGICGDIQTKEVVNKVKNIFANFKARNLPPIPFIKEPESVGLREIKENSNVKISRVAFIYKGVDISDPDMCTLDVISFILGGGEGSRLNRLLCQNKRLVDFVKSYNFTPKSEGIFVITCITDTQNIDSIKKEVLREIEAIKAKSVNALELEKAKNAVITDYLFSHESIEEEIQRIVADEALTGNPNFSKIYVENISKVSKKDIAEVANRFLNLDQLTIVSLLPQSAGKDVALESRSYRPGIKRIVLPNRLTLLLMEDRSLPVVSINVAIKAGLRAQDTKDNGISNITANMLTGGTQYKSKKELVDSLELMGVNFKAYSGNDAIDISLEFLSKDTNKVIDLLRQLLFYPKFPNRELQIEKSLVYTKLKDEEDDIFDIARKLLKKNLLQKHPYGFDPLGTVDGIKGISRNDVLSFHKRFFVPNNMVIALYGDIDIDKITEVFKKKWISFKPQDIDLKVTKEKLQYKPILIKEELDKKQSLIMLGFGTTSVYDNDKYVLEMISGLLSGEGGLLYEEIRQKLGLSYTQAAASIVNIEGGYFLVYVATTEGGLEKVKDVLFKVIELLKKEDLDEAKIEMAKRYLIGKRLRDLETNSSLALRTSLDELYGLGFDNFKEYENRITKVTKKDIIETSRRYLDLNKATIIQIRSKGN